MLLIPLSKLQSRGDQLLNAKIFEKQGWASVLEEENVTPTTFINSLKDVSNRAEHMRLLMENSELPKTPDEMVRLITSNAK